MVSEYNGISFLTSGWSLSLSLSLSFSLLLLFISSPRLSPFTSPHLSESRHVHIHQAHEGAVYPGVLRKSQRAVYGDYSVCGVVRME